MFEAEHTTYLTNIAYRSYALQKGKNDHTRKWKRVVKVTYCDILEGHFKLTVFLTLGNVRKTGWYMCVLLDKVIDKITHCIQYCT